MEIKKNLLENLNIVQHRYFLQKRAKATAKNKSDQLTDIINTLAGKLADVEV